MLQPSAESWKGESPIEERSAVVWRERENARIEERLVPGHVVLVEEEVDKLNAIAKRMLGALGHGKDRADRFARFEVLQWGDPRIPKGLML